MRVVIVYIKPELPKVTMTISDEAMQKDAQETLAAYNSWDERPHSITFKHDCGTSSIPTTEPCIINLFTESTIIKQKSIGKCFPPYLLLQLLQNLPWVKRASPE
ncbi:MAG: hypothetical protein EON58_14495 [Alphaproteobacteria bacterium]|nr:MAG: hypothetical protein EON58_14495 [Alphaproteobacteria bacterium]